jgi:transcriptional regulator with XRE-family HTH domain
MLNTGNRTARKVTAIDVAIGKRIRAQRIMRGMSQTDLAFTLGLSFQQVQKYEKGTNRVSCGKLAIIAQKLGVDPMFLFGQLPGKHVNGGGDNLIELLAAPGAVKLLRAYLHIQNPDVGRALIALAEQLGNPDGDISRAHH